MAINFVCALENIASVQLETRSIQSPSAARLPLSITRRDCEILLKLDDVELCAQYLLINFCLLSERDGSGLRGWFASRFSRFLSGDRWTRSYVITLTNERGQSGGRCPPFYVRCCTSRPCATRLIDA